MKRIKEFLLSFVLVPFIVVAEVVGVSELYPVCKGSFWKLLLLYFGVYFTYDVYRKIKNYTEY